MENQLNKVAGWIFGGGFILIGLFFLTLGGRLVRQGLQTDGWPAASGRIIGSTIETSSSPSGSRRNRASVRDTDYSVRIRYSYEVAGQKLEGDRLKYGYESHDDRSSALREQSLYPTGMEVQVYYDPKNPNQSVLVKGIGLSWLAVGAGLLALVLGLIVMFHVARSRRAGIRVNILAS